MFMMDRKGAGFSVKSNGEIAAGGDGMGRYPKVKSVSFEELLMSQEISQKALQRTIGKG